MKPARVFSACCRGWKQLLLSAFYMLIIISSTGINTASTQGHQKNIQRNSEYLALKKRQIIILKELKEIQKDFSDVKKELAEMKQLLKQLQSPPAPTPPASQADSQSASVQSELQPQAEIAKPSAQGAMPPNDANQSRVLSIAGAPYLGKPDAPLTLVEFSDYQCLYCSRHAKQTMPQIVQAYVETGKLKYVQREFPVVKFHPNAYKAAEAALCAGDQGKYWDMHNQLYNNYRQLSRAELPNHAKTVGLDLTRFMACLDDNKYTQRIQNDIEDGVKAGVKATPSFFLGLTDPDDPTKIKVFRHYQGAYSYSIFQGEIDQLLSRISKKDP